MNMVLVGTLTAMIMGLTSAEVAAKPAVAEADRLFGTAKAVCEHDGGKLWGVSLCGPILLVDYHDHTVLANQPDAQRLLTPDGKWFGGRLPDDVIIANTPTEWAGRRWTQIDAPLPADDTHLRVLIAHELFHRIQGQLGLTRPEAGNRHLDTLEGRYLLQLEWRALARALRAPTTVQEITATHDALAFRQERYRLFPAAATEESALEIAEGIPEYTGVMIGLDGVRERVTYAVGDLAAFVSAPTFVRSFAYATGPAYGLLLDQAKPDWKSHLNDDHGLDALLASAIPQDTGSSLRSRVTKYDDGTLRAAEVDRERGRQTRLAALRARLIDGPIIHLPLDKTNYQFNPQTLVALDDVGTVYPTMRLLDTWGALTVESGGALVKADGSAASVTARGLNERLATGDGWRLELAPGWHIVPDHRAGDYTITHAADSADKDEKAHKRRPANRRLLVQNSVEAVGQLLPNVRGRDD